MGFLPTGIVMQPKWPKSVKKRLEDVTIERVHEADVTPAVSTSQSHHCPDRSVVHVRPYIPRSHYNRLLLALGKTVGDPSKQLLGMPFHMQHPQQASGNRVTVVPQVYDFKLWRGHRSRWRFLSHMVTLMRCGLVHMEQHMQALGALASCKLQYC
jgi:hypothetical protein